MLKVLKGASLLKFAHQIHAKVMDSILLTNCMAACHTDLLRAMQVVSKGQPMACNLTVLPVAVAVGLVPDEVPVCKQ